jgi:hypothetical protein
MDHSEDIHAFWLAAARRVNRRTGNKERDQASLGNMALLVWLSFLWFGYRLIFLGGIPKAWGTPGLMELLCLAERASKQGGQVSDLTAPSPTKGMGS